MASPFLTPPPLSPPSYQQSYDNGSEGVIKNSKHFLNLSLESQTLRTKIKFFHLKGTVCAISSNPPHLCLIYLWLRYVGFCLFKLFIFICGFSAKVTSAFLSIYKKQWSQTRMYLPHFDQLKVSKVRLWIEHCYLCMSLKLLFFTNLIKGTVDVNNDPFRKPKWKNTKVIQNRRWMTTFYVPSNLE